MKKIARVILIFSLLGCVPKAYISQRKTNSGTVVFPVVFTWSGKPWNTSFKTERKKAYELIQTKHCKDFEVLEEGFVLPDSIVWRAKFETREAYIKYRCK